MNSSTASACFLVTPGNHLMNSSIVAPSSRFSKSARTGTRVFVNTGTTFRPKRALRTLASSREQILHHHLGQSQLATLGHGKFHSLANGDHEGDHLVATSLLSQSSRPSPKSAIHTNRARSSLPWAVSGQRSTGKKLTGIESGSRRAGAQAAKASAPGSTAFGRSS